MDEPGEKSGGSRLPKGIQNIAEELGIIYASPAHANLLKRARVVAHQGGPILIEGETGTGKSQLARFIHHTSFRHSGPLIEVNCGGLPENLFESTLFGHVRGAYTGALANRKGLLDRAHKGTLVLNDFDLLSKPQQCSLLDVLDRDGYFRVGEEGIFRGCEINWVFTTNKNIQSYIRQGLFMPDLYFRMRRWRLLTTPLRDRPEDIRALATKFLQANKSLRNPGEPPWYFDQDALNLLTTLPWPGNIRQLKEAVVNTAIFTDVAKPPITRVKVEEILYDPVYPIIDDGREKTADRDDDTFRDALEESDWNISQAAKALNCSRNTLYKRIKENGWSRTG